MFDRWRKYSYTAQKDQRHRIRWVVLWFLAFFSLYLFLTTFIVSTRVLRNDTMQPGLRAGDRMLFVSTMIYRLLPDVIQFNRSPPFKRGSIVLVDTSQGERRGLMLRLLEPVARFFTAQQAALARQDERFFVKRVIALPGDEIMMTNFVIRVRAAGSGYNLTEFELTDRPYDVTIPQLPALWDESLPFSGNMERIVLAEDECFVLSDDRSNTNDSRTWGPIPVDYITGTAVFRYWPPARLGRP